MAINDIYRVTFVQSVNGQRVANVMTYKQTAGSGSTDPKIDLATGLDAGLGVAMKAGLVATWIALCWEIAQIDLPGQPFFKQLSTSGSGSVLSAGFNAGVVATIAEFTATGSHDGTGRFFVSGLPIAYENRNNLNTTGLTAIGLIGDELIKPVVSGGLTFVPGRAPGFKKDPASTPEVPLDDLPTLFDPWILEDVRIPLTKLRSRRQSAKC